MLDRISPANKRDAWLFCIIMWFHRNSIAHGSSLSSMADVGKWSKAFLDDFITANHTSGDKRKTRHKSEKDNWKPPEEDFYKVNCDAWVDRNGYRTGIGVIIQDSIGNELASCAQSSVANLSTKAAKLTAILKSIRFSMDCGLAPCVFEIDDALVVKWINEVQLNLSENGVLLDDINSLASNLRSVSFSHTSKGANGTARRLARHALDITEDAYWMQEFPTCIRELVLADKHS
ncbi:hypothetical protein Dsin_016776 [Dipteronia sinensis]|uniref:RNase H type-1 domain-containing protein n=1 Tax=Dipteronia sinensis TaxID=43782 RepID=A0AAE0ADQ8_9ROSI|nr:hypothetical protein Dsin_016776 [Dipteronia sinensis]